MKRPRTRTTTSTTTIRKGTVPPRKTSHPHSHPPDRDEIWYVVKGNGWHWMGQELQPQGPGTALWLVPTETPSLLTPSDDDVVYLYVASEH